MHAYIFVAIAVALVALFLVIRFFVTSHILGTFRFDNSSETYRCRLEFDVDLDIVEKKRFAIVRIKESDLSLPGERKSQN